MRLPAVVAAVACVALCAAFSFGRRAPQDVVRSDPHRQSSTPARDAALARVEAALAASDLTDATVVVGSGDVDPVVFAKGKGGADVVYEADSAQKWILATLLLRDARRRGVTLDQPLSTWPSIQQGQQAQVAWATQGEKASLTLRDFLSFTSGFEDPPVCASVARGTWQQCLPKLTSSKLTTPRRFWYGTHHMMVALAGLSAADDDAHPSDTLLRRFQTETKLLPTTKHDSDKPLSLLTTPGEYAAFLRALTRHELLTTAEETAMMDDQVGDRPIGMSPAQRARIAGTWHYGLGNWLRCDGAGAAAGDKGPAPPCGPHHHSAGARGFYPFVDTDTGVYGVIAWNRRPGDWDKSHALYLAVSADLVLVTRVADAAAPPR